MNLRARIRRLEKQMQQAICVVVADQSAINADSERWQTYISRIETEANERGLKVIVLSDDVPLAVSPQGRLVYDFDPENANPKPGGIERLLHYAAWLRTGDDGYTPPHVS